MIRLIAAWALILACGAVPPALSHAASGLVQANNFQADARDAARRKIPVLVLFSSPFCHFCERVKEEYLLPMHKDRAYRSKVVIREVEVGSTRPIVGFDGKPTTEGAFAAASKVFMVPTVKVFDLRGNEASEPLIGLLTPDYYFGHLQAAIDEGARKVRGK